jgi:hypothetical protein
MVASWPVHSATRSNAFWKQLIQWDMPWLWEFQEATAADQVQETDFKKLYLDLNRMTEPKLHLRSPFLGLANRRRVWGVCQQLADLYFQRISHDEPGDAPGTYAQTILDHSESVQMPAVLYPPPEGEVNTISKQLITSWVEMDNRLSVFETIWDSSGSLMGLAITFGNDRRLFGRDQGKDSTRSSVAIDATDWIEGLILKIPDIDLTGTKFETSIQGITVRPQARM